MILCTICEFCGSNDKVRARVAGLNGANSILALQATYASCLSDLFLLVVWNNWAYILSRICYNTIQPHSSSKHSVCSATRWGHSTGTSWCMTIVSIHQLNQWQLDFPERTHWSISRMHWPIRRFGRWVGPIGRLCTCLDTIWSVTLKLSQDEMAIIVESWLISPSRHNRVCSRVLV